MKSALLIFSICISFSNAMLASKYKPLESPLPMQEVSIQRYSGLSNKELSQIARALKKTEQAKLEIEAAKPAMTLCPLPQLNIFKSPSPKQAPQATEATSSSEVACQSSLQPRTHKPRLDRQWSNRALLTTGIIAGTSGFIAGVYLTHTYKK